MKYKVIIQPHALKMLEGIRDRRTRGKIAFGIGLLSEEPEKRGRPLLEELAGYRSLRAAGQRYRIVYCVEREKSVVSVVAVGIRKEGDRKDICSLAEKIVKLGLVESPFSKKP